MKLGIDIGSTTVKLVLLNDDNNIIYSRYERHMSNVFLKVRELIEDAYKEQGNLEVNAVITGSGGLSLAKVIGLPFEQEVVACSRAVEDLIPQTDTAIELGGEDAKITFYGSTIEQRMNGTCAGGTGAFIDQMAVLLNTDAAGLNEAAKNAKIIYPIAARCGVFAKTDIQPLINEGAAIEDLSASIFQSVVNQTISGLACGHPIKGNVAFLGGPLSFLSELRKRFIETLDLTEDQVIFPEDSRYFVAIGAARLAEKYGTVTLGEIDDRIKNSNASDLQDTKYLDSLFKDDEDFNRFIERHNRNKVRRGNIEDAVGNVYLGIDAGSTTTKAALINEDKEVIYSFYRNNEGKPLDTVLEILNDLYSKLPEGAVIARSCVTGYGEGLVKTAFKLDMGQIETMAHYKAAEEFLPGVDFILDIGGQDMKCMRIKDGAIYNIMLNEACSSGCGSFIETYAKSVEMSVSDFAEQALFADNPVDLGTRCTVFMNSKVKQAQKEGATIGDISAGLSYSVIKNALYKVIKLRNPDEAGDKIVVQGGTFLNNAILRSIETILGKEVVRPDISGIMGAFGSALIAKESYTEGRSTILTPEELSGFAVSNTHARCNGCENRCMLTINKFSDGSRFITGNRCEKGEGKISTESSVPDMFEYKFERLFSYESLKDAPRGRIGIPRVLNMYENYPFWHTFFTELGFEVVLSAVSNKEIYEMGMDTISSDTACYPAKLVHGHIKWLCKEGVDRIFYPSINYERVEDSSQPNHYNCPIVATYPEVIGNNMDDCLADYNTEFLHPFLPYDKDDVLPDALARVFTDIPKDEIRNAVKKAREEDKRYHQDIKAKGREILEYIERTGKKGVVICGRPYHVDPEINHGINKLITSFDMPLLTEDSIADMVDLARPVRVLDQWVYHSRMYRAATYAGTRNDIEIVQLNSFGCGLDAVTTDQVEEICRYNNKLYTVLKIDEGSSLGAARIRVRSLKAAIDERDRNEIAAEPENKPYDRVVYTKEMNKEYTILVPQMAPYHFRHAAAALNSSGYKAVELPPVSVHAVDEGLRYINNDACYPTIVSLGQIISALKSGEFDLDKTAVFMSQTGGQCRASNYVSLLRKALKDMNMEQVPIISVNMAGLEKNPGFRFTPALIKRALMGVVYGDMFMRVVYRTRPYERDKGSADALYEKWAKIADENVKNGNMKEFARNLKGIVLDFDELPLVEMRKPKVGVVGEILVKYHPTANNDIVGVIESEGGEAVVPDLMDFFLYCTYNKKFNYENLGGKWSAYKGNMIAADIIEQFRKPYRKALRESVRFEEPARIEETAHEAEKITSIGNQCGEGWLLTGEMVDLINAGCENIVCLQPFACLPNHVTGKGMLKAIRKYNPKANIAAIDYDPGASSVNQLNRIKLMMATAYKNMEK